MLSKDVENIHNLRENRNIQNIPKQSMDKNIEIAHLNVDLVYLAQSNERTEILMHHFEQYPIGTATKNGRNVEQRNLNERDVTQTATNVNSFSTGLKQVADTAHVNEQNIILDTAVALIQMSGVFSDSNGKA